MASLFPQGNSLCIDGQMNSICRVDHIHNSARAKRICPAEWRNTISKTDQLDDIQRRGKCSLQNKQHLKSVRMSVQQSNP